MNKKLIWSSVIAVSVIGLVGANVYNLNKTIDVSVAAAEEGAISETVFASGQIESAEVQHYFAPASGIVEKLSVKPGDAVKKGQTLYTLRVDELQQQLKMEQNNVKIAEAEREAARKQNAAAQSNPLLSGQKVDLTLYDLKIENARMSVEAVQKKIASATVTASNAGVVTQLDIKAGQMLMEGAPALVIANPGALQVRAQIGELDAGKVQQGLAVTVSGDAFADSTYPGKLTYLAPTAAIANPAAKDPSVEMVVALDNPAPKLRPGYNATVEITLTEAERHPLVPLEAVKREGDKALVYRVENGKAVEAEVKTGKEDETHIEILSGLSAGDEIIKSVPEDLRAGKKVKVQ
ncbi:RND family efflux transporter MFP subunit [Tumebacillus sp. BK434]|uniref:efflux RND transporter periplasmic adaptor subunit n=1 Tax=Tumebacillus sp. BK434 TaxID=2512169 RepID=UPI00104D711C|nr:efflux RND transporter periplasmic adaptor subunit [Tumebacillus sp. BK434]TCP55924.1 RND family efflux transporter MFP subunit [Tumebacillus sp. BK434]